MITADPNAKTSPKHRPCPRSVLGESKSISVFQSPHPSPTPGSAKMNSPFASKFTARNLPLPTSPSPLPKHPSQFSNTSGKARRLTIEHDMDRLAGEHHSNDV